MEILCGSPSVINVVHLEGAAQQPDGDLILCDVAREDASVIIGGPQGARDPALGLDLGGRRADTVISDAAEQGRARRAGAPLGRRRVGGGRAADEREHRALGELRGLHGARHADRGGRHPARPADPDRGRDGGGARSSARWPALSVALVQRQPELRPPLAGGAGGGLPRGRAARPPLRARVSRWTGRVARRRSIRAATRSPTSSPTRTSSPSSWPSWPGSPGCCRSPRPSRAR